MNPEDVNYSVAVVSDRGLSQKRPINQDSYFADPERGLFAVADGVGGGNAGEVASQTAMEVLSEAFRHHLPEADYEDLMELAIQRANSSIHQMAQEHPKLAEMATTIVALHLNGNTATIGHVGDSRLYRLSPGGKLFRETSDHSFIEEEVRAGRITPEQALRDPRRNVISRALGAEETVEVDMKTIEVVEGTKFLICSDGITRHISDDELHEMINSYNDLDSVCQLLKSLCFERGAEDNLTAVVVKVDSGNQFDEYEDERTVSTARPAVSETVPLDQYNVPQTTPLSAEKAETVALNMPMQEANIDFAQSYYHPSPQRAATTQPSAPPMIQQSVSQSSDVKIDEPVKKKGGFIWGFIKIILILLLLAAVAIGAFYGGMLYEKRNSPNTPPTNPTTTTP